MISETQQRFYDLLDRAPERVQALWNRERKQCNRDNAKAQMRSMSSGELHLAKFFMSVWFWDNSKVPGKGFDLADAMGSVDANGQAIIRNWVNDPFWP